MMTLFVILTLVVLGLLYRQYKNRSAAQKAAQGTGLSAFARLAEADGKIIALKAATDLKLAEAKAQHVVLDEIHKILG